MPRYQKLILDSKYDDLRENSVEEIDEFISKLSIWIIVTYKKMIHKNIATVGDKETRFINDFLSSYKEVLI